MGVRKSEINKIENEVEHIFTKSDARIKAGCDPVQADWQATLELFIFMR